MKSAPPGRYSDGAGLLLRVKSNGRRYWLVRVMAEGRRREFGLGNAGPGGTGLAEARAQAAQLRTSYKAGVDPVAARSDAVRARRAASARAASLTFRTITEHYLASHTATLKSPKHAGLWRSTLETYAFPVLGEVPIAAVTGPMVLEALESVWSRAPETGRRVRQRIGAVLDFAHARGWREAKPDLAALTSKALPKHSEVAGHHAALPYPQAAAAVTVLRAGSETMGRLALLFTIFTAARSGEIRGATWTEIDLAKREWTIPAARMKMAKTHTVPLSGSALAVLAIAARARLSGDPAAWLFPGSGGRQLSDMTMTKVHRAEMPGATVHGWRSTFRDWAAETTDFPADVCEAALAHSFGGKVQRAYQRGDLLEKRRALMNAWDDYLTATSR